MDERLFTTDDAWLGGFYELAMEVGPRSDDQLRAAILALWAHPDLEGCFRDRKREPADQERVPPDLFDDGWGSHLLGIARLPNGSRVACGSCMVREANGPDWLDLYLPLGSLATAYDVGGSPFESENGCSHTWREQIDETLAGIGLWVAQSVSFELGIIGFEVSGQVYASEIDSRGIPEKRFIGYLWPNDGSVAYYRRNVA
jgi:hypothetical protein